MISIGFVGCGHIARAHSWCLRQLVRSGLVEATVSVATDEDHARAETLAAHWGARVVRDADQVAEACDVVWVCTWTAAHLPAVRAAAERGKAVFCEKPLAPTLALARETASALDRVPHQVGLVLRRAPVFVALRDRLTAGVDGQVLTAMFRDDQYLPVQGMYGSTWRVDPSAAGGGTLIEHSIHDVDLLCWLLGPASTVTAATRTALGNPGIDDVAAVTTTHDGGPVSSLLSVWHQVLSRASTRRLEVFCEKAVLWLEDDYLGPLHIQTDAGHEAVPCPVPAWAQSLDVPDELRRTAAAYGGPALEFLTWLAAGAKGASPGPTARDALAAHEVVDAAYRSAALGGVPMAVE